MARKIEIEIVGDTKGLSKAFNQAGQDTTSFGNKLAKVGTLAAAGLAALGAGAVFAGKKMADMAGDAAEVDSKMGVVFGKQLPALKAKLDAFSDATGASSFKLREQAADMGALLGPLVGTQKGAADMSEQFVKLATDLGSFNNVPVDDALLAIRSGLVGEAEPLRAFGVLINEAAVKTEALSMGLVKGKEELTEQQKVMARASLIMKQTTQAQGDATRTAGSYANQMKALRNTVTDVATGLGAALLPAITTVVSGLNDFINKFSEAEGASAKFGVVMDAVKDIAGKAWEALKGAFNAINWGEVWEAVSSALAQAASFVANLPWGTWMAAAATAAWTALQSAYKAVNWGEVGRIIGDALVTALNRLASFIGSVNWGAAGAAIVAGMATVIAALAKFLAGVDWPTVLVAIGKGILAVLSIMPQILLGAARAIGEKIIDGIEAGLAKLGAAVKAKLAALPDTLANIARALPGEALAAGIAIVTGIVTGLGSLREKVNSKLGELAGALAETAAKAFGWALQIGAEIAVGIIAGLGDLAVRLGTWIANKVKAGIDWAKNNVGSTAAEYASKQIGEPGGQGIVTGFLLGLNQLPEKLSEKIRSSLEHARTVVEAQQGRLGDAFGNLGEYVARQFGAKTEAELSKIAAKFDRQIARITARADAATPAEAELNRISKDEAARSRQRAVDEAAEQTKAADAMDEGVEKAKAVAAAKEAVRVADLANTIAKLEETAAVERKKADERAAEDIARLEKAKARELQNYEERRRQMEESLDRQLESLGKRLALHPEEHDKIQKKIIKLLNSYGVPMEKSGKLLGDAFADGIRASYGNVERAVKKLAQLVADFVPHSPAKRGPLKEMPDWRSYFTAGLSQAFNGTTAAMSGGGAGFPSMAMAGATSGGGRGGAWPERITVELDRRVLAEAVRTEVMRQQARNR